MSIDFSKPLETSAGDSVKYICADVIEYMGARVCVDQETGFVYSSPYVNLKIRNVKQAWSGEGLPPVGSMVMIDRMGLTIWPDAEQFIGPDVKVLANYKAGDEDMIVVESPDERSNCCFRACMARPIRTPEQIAAEERDTAVRNIMGLGGIQRQSAEWIYDAGYRKEVKS